MVDRFRRDGVEVTDALHMGWKAMPLFRRMAFWLLLVGSAVSLSAASADVDLEVEAV